MKRRISTKDQKIRNSLKKNEERFKIVFQSAPIGMTIWGSETGICYEMNQAAIDIYGRTREELETVHWEELSHPDEIEENKRLLKEMLVGKINSFTLEKRFYRASGEVIWVRMKNVFFGYTEDGDHLHLCMLDNINEEKRLQTELEALGYQDQLTGLSNRRVFEKALITLDNPEYYSLSLVVVDINGLKLTNDTFGHDAGDQLIRVIANELERGVKEEACVARVGGDEFAILLPNQSNEETRTAVEKIIEKIEKNKIKNSVVCSASFGWDTKMSSNENIRTVYRNAEYLMYKRKLCDSEKMRNETIRIIVKKLNSKSSREKEHCDRVANLCREFGLIIGMGRKDISNMAIAAQLHDIGKVGVKQEILDKPGKLTKEEYEEVKKHTEIGFQLLRGTSEFAAIAEIALSHHERIDGKGYPRGIKGDDITLQAKVVAIVDAFDAMTRDRPYREKVSEREALEELKRNAGTQFDRGLVNKFVDFIKNRNDL